MNYRALKFKLRMKTWPLRVALMSLSWLPVWWVRKTVPPLYRSWSPASTIRRLTDTVDLQEKQYQSAMRGWRKTTKELEVAQRELFRLSTTPEQQTWLKETMGIDLEHSK